MKTIDQIIDTAESLSQAVIAWHIERGGSMSDTTNPVSFSESEAQVLARHKQRMEAQPVIGGDTDFGFLSSPNFDIIDEEEQ